jgi:hypothetical protein
MVLYGQTLIRRKLGVISKKTVNEIEKKLMDLFLEDK